MDDKYISFYGLAREMMREDGSKCADYNKENKDSKYKDDQEEKFRNYRNTRLKYFKEILRNHGVMCNGRFKIPVKAKESVKLLIREYTSRYYKKIRKNETPNVDETEEMIKKAEEVIKKYFNNDEQKEQMTALYGSTEYYSKKKSCEVYDRLKKLIKKNINDIKRKGTDGTKVVENNSKIISCENADDVIDIHHDGMDDLSEMRNLSENDAVVLIDYYEKMLNAVTDKWNKLADIFSDLRENEIEDIAFEDMKSNDNLKDIYESEGKYKDPQDVLKESLNILNDELNEKNERPKLTEDELKNVGDLIRTHRSGKQ